MKTKDKRTRRVRDRVFVIFERSRRYRDRYRCQEKKSRRSRALRPVFRDPPRRERDLDRCSRFATPTPRPFLYNCGPSTVSSTVYSMQYSIHYAVQYTVYSIQNNHLCQQLFTKFTSKRKAEINKFYILTYFNSLVDR